MSKDPFIILGVNRESVNQSELYDAYRIARSKYEEDRFLEGEAGAQAARKISEIDQAYHDALDELQSRTTFSGGGIASFDEVEKAIRAKDLIEAQRLLDTITNHTAEWHYLQSVIYYKKGWFNESKAQLETAVSLDPSNAKYRSELNKMNFNGERVRNDQQYSNRSYGYGYDNHRSYHHSRPVGDDSCCNLCSTLCAIDCCCECMGGDCIPCC